MEYGNLKLAENTTSCIKYCDGINKAKLFEPETFNEAYLNYITDAFLKETTLTDRTFHGQVFNALNILYLDIDYTIDKNLNTDNIEDEEIELAHTYINNIMNEDGSNNYVCFLFIPDKFLEEDNKKKCGAHVFIYLDHNVNKTERVKLYNTAKQKVFNNSSKINKISELLHIKPNDFNNDVYNKVFDLTPLKTASCLLLFAEKHGAKRRYKLVEKPNMENLYFGEILIKIIPTSHEENFIEETTTTSEELTLSDDIGIKLNSVQNLDELINSKIVLGTLEFFEKLIILSQEHIFWKLLGNHTKRLNEIIKPLLYWCFLFEFLNNPYNLKDATNAITLKISNILIKLMRVIDISDKDKKRIRRCYVDVESMKKTLFSGEPFNFLLDEQLAELHDKIKDVKNEDKKEFIISKYVKSNLVLSDNEETDDKQKNKIIQRKVKLISSELKAIKTIANNTILPSFSRFIKMIMKHMTNEILPFKTIPENLNIKNKDKTLHDSKLFLNEEFLRQHEEFNEYYETIKIFLRMFICIMFYNNECNDTIDAVRLSISAFTMKYVYILKEKNITIIYNIRQTRDLQSYPRNQFIKDIDCKLTISWFSYIYDTFINEELNADHRIKFITPFLDGLYSLGYNHFQKKRVLIPLTNFKENMNKISNNILLNAEIDINRPEPKVMDICGESNYLPMLNGIGEWITTPNKKSGLKIGDFVLHKDNFDKYFEAGTLIPYHKNYNINNPVYKKVKTIIKQIYPIKEEREYVLLTFAQCLHSIGTRDQFYQMYGTGGEGKSLFNNMICHMLGCGNEVCISTVNYHIPQLKRPNGLAATVKPDAIIGLNKSGGHDSGGVFELVNKRFATIAEPDIAARDATINVSLIKALTGDMVMNVREIFGKAQNALIKLIITMQTNILANTSEHDDGVSRRISTIEHRSKFTTATNKKYSGDFVFKADTTLPNSVHNDPNYYEALFNVFKPIYSIRIIVI